MVYGRIYHIVFMIIDRVAEFNIDIILIIS